MGVSVPTLRKQERALKERFFDYMHSRGYYEGLTPGRRRFRGRGGGALVLLLWPGGLP